MLHGRVGAVDERIGGGRRKVEIGREGTRSGRFGSRSTMAEGRSAVGLHGQLLDGASRAHDGGQFVESRKVGTAGRGRCLLRWDGGVGGTEAEMMRGHPVERAVHDGRRMAVLGGGRGGHSK